MYDAAFWLYHNRTAFSNSTYATQIATFQQKMVAIDGNYQAFKQKYPELVEDISKKLTSNKENFLLLF
jgi:hypothetical protein